jgi:hypothetical protein
MLLSYFIVGEEGYVEIEIWSNATTAGLRRSRLSEKGEVCVINDEEIFLVLLILEDESI